MSDLTVVAADITRFSKEVESIEEQIKSLSKDLTNTKRKLSKAKRVFNNPNKLVSVDFSMSIHGVRTYLGTREVTQLEHYTGCYKTPDVKIKFI